MSGYDPERSIPNVSKNESIQLWKEYTVRDAVIVIFPLFFAVLPIMLWDFLPTPIVLIGVVISVSFSGVGVAVIATAPDHYTSWEWISVHVNDYIEPDELDHIKHHTSQPHREQKRGTAHGLLSEAFATDQRTQDLLDIKRVYPPDDTGPGMVEQTDGTVIAAIRVHPANLTLGTGRQWRQATNQLKSTANTFDHEVKFHYTTREFDTEKFIQPYEERQLDEDVMNEPALEEVLGRFVDWYPQRIEEENVMISDHYLVVGVREDEVVDRTGDNEDSSLLTQLPVVGERFEDEDDELPEAVVRGRQREELYERLSRTESRARDVRGVDTEIIRATEHAKVISKGWRREEINTSVSTTGVVNHVDERNIAESSASNG